MNNGPFGPTPGPYDPNQQPQQQNPYGNAPLAPSSFGPGGGGGPASDDTMAWVAIGTSSLSWLSCCCTPIPLLGIFFAGGGILFSIAGVVCGYLALQKAKQANTRTDLAMIGLVLGAVRLGLTVAVFGVIIVALIAGVGVGVLEGITHPQ